MSQWSPRAALAAVLCLLPLLAWAQGDEEPRTLRVLEDREITITPSQPQPASLEEMRANYRQLLGLTHDPEARNPILRRLANVELAVATKSRDPKPAARRALTIYQQLLQVHSYHARQADLLYRAAHAADLAGDTAAGLVMLTRLINNQPDFKLLPEAYFRRAETRFVVGNFRLAEQDYSWLVTNGKDSPYYLQALYKRGWTNYKLADYRQALTDQLAALQLLLGKGKVSANGELALAGLSEAKASLAQDALRNMTLDFALLGDSYSPGQFVQDAKAPTFEYILVKNLFDYYLENERYTDASKLALDFAKRNPEHPQAKALEVASINALEAGGYDVAALKAKQDYVMRYGLGSETWYGKDPMQVPQVRERLRDYLDQITSSLHAGAQKTGLAVDYLSAAKWYANYLKVFPKSPRAAELTFYRADTLYAAKHYADAAQGYAKVAYDMAPNEHAAEAGYAALLAWRKAAGAQVAGNPKVRAATLKFAKVFPSHPEANPALAKLTAELYNSGDLAGAMVVATKLIEHQPPGTPEQLANAWRVRAAAAMDAKEYKKAEEAYSWLIANLPSSEHRAKNQKRLATAIYLQAQALAKVGDDKAAAEELLRLREVVPPGAAEEIRSKALYDAAAAYIRAGDKKRAIGLLETFRRSYPNQKLVPETTRKLAELQLEAGNTAAAAREFARVRGQTRLDPAARLAAANQAATLSAKAGDVAGAIAAYEILLQKFHPDPETAMEARHQLVVLNQKAGHPQRADRWRHALVQAESSAGAASSDRSRTLAAQAALALAKDKRAAFAAVELTPPLKKSLALKQKRLKAALAAFDQAADYGIAEVTTAATYYTGELYYDFGHALLGSPRPRELSDQELAQYETLLQQHAMPFTQKAISVQQTNLQRVDNGIYNQWVAKSLAQLAMLDPARYGRQERMGDGIVTLQ